MEGSRGQGDGGAKGGVEEAMLEREVGDPFVLVYTSAQQAHTITKHVPLGKSTEGFRHIPSFPGVVGLDVV